MSATINAAVLSPSVTKLSLGTKLTFGAGAIAEAVYRGLSNTLVGDALTDPLVSMLSNL